MDLNCYVSIKIPLAFWNVISNDVLGIQRSFSVNKYEYNHLWIPNT